MLNLLKRHRQDGLQNLTPAHMVKYARAMKASQDLTTHASLGLPMLLLMTWLWANAVDEESGCLDRYPSLAHAFLVYAWTGRILAVLFVAGTCMQCLSPAKLLEMLQLTHVVRNRRSSGPVGSLSGGSSSFLDVTYEAALDLLDFSGQQWSRVLVRASVRQDTQQPRQQQPQVAVEGVAEQDGVQVEEQASRPTAADDETQHRHEVSVVEDEAAELSEGEEEEATTLMPGPDDIPGSRGEEWSSWDVLHWSLWALLHMVVLVVIGFSAYSLTGHGVRHYPACGSVEG